MAHVKVARVLRDRFSADGLIWVPEHYRQLTAQYPDGVPEAALDGVMAMLTTPACGSVISIINDN